MQGAEVEACSGVLDGLLQNAAEPAEQQLAASR